MVKQGHQQSGVKRKMFHWRFNQAGKAHAETRRSGARSFEVEFLVHGMVESSEMLFVSSHSDGSLMTCKTGCPGCLKRDKLGIARVLSLTARAVL